jgi:hypothetical protein
MLGFVFATSMSGWSAISARKAAAARLTGRFLKSHECRTRAGISHSSTLKQCSQNNPPVKEQTLMGNRKMSH